MSEKEIFIFHAEEFSTNELWQIVRDNEQLKRDGCIGDCLMRQIAAREARNTYTVLSMESITARAQRELLKRYFPFLMPSKGEVVETDARLLVREILDLLDYHIPEREAEYETVWEPWRKKARALLAEPVEQNSWRSVIDDALVCRFLLNKENENDPKKALNDIINWEVQVSKDPRVSSDALFTPIPLSERKPEPEDLDDCGRCWLISEIGGSNWALDEPPSETNHTWFTHFAPWWALPRPQLKPLAQRHQWC